MKGYYLIYDTFHLENPDGIEKKILSQKELLCQNGIELEFYILKKNRGTFWNNPVALKDADFVYFRRGTIIDVRLIRYLRKVKQGNPRMIIFMEIPTFPYEGEYDKTLRNAVALRIDHLCRGRLRFYVNRLVVVNSRQKNLWGMRVINFVNGVDVKSIPLRKLREADGKIKICCVAKFSPWHGYERIICGLSDYYRTDPEIEVNLVMVGIGEETGRYKSLVSELSLERYVTFTGQLTGAKLDAVYDESDIGCCSLGRYKSGIDVIGDLKSRELMAKGMPMICGCKIDVLENADYPYAIYFPNDDSPIDIKKVITCYQKMIQETGIEIMSRRIREFAERHIDLRVTFQPIVDEAIELFSQM